MRMGTNLGVSLLLLLGAGCARHYTTSRYETYSYTPSTTTYAVPSATGTYRERTTVYAPATPPPPPTVTAPGVTTVYVERIAPSTGIEVLATTDADVGLADRIADYVRRQAVPPITAPGVVITVDHGSAVLQGSVDNPEQRSAIQNAVNRANIGEIRNEIQVR